MPINALGVSADGEPVALIQPLTFLDGVAGGASSLMLRPSSSSHAGAGEGCAAGLLSSSYADAQLASTDPGPSKTMVTTTTTTTTTTMKMFNTLIFSSMRHFQRRFSKPQL